MVKITASCEKCGHEESTQIESNVLLQHSGRGLLTKLGLTYVGTHFACKKCRAQYEDIMEKQKQERKLFYTGG